MRTLSHQEEAVEQFQERVRAELDHARLQENLSRIAELQAMLFVLETWALPVACPFTVMMAGRAAVASLHGEGESECCAEAYRRYGHFPEGRLEVSTAIRLLKVAGLWPWAGSA